MVLTALNVRTHCRDAPVFNPRIRFSRKTRQRLLQQRPLPPVDGGQPLRLPDTEPLRTLLLQLAPLRRRGLLRARCVPAQHPGTAEEGPAPQIVRLFGFALDDAAARCRR